jgi:ABC-type glycerol-3-phosphate transport system substrate-binding protein
MKKILSLIFLTVILSACMADGATVAPESTATSAAAKTPQTESTVETASRLEVNEEALRGLEITVWTPWYGIESSLFDSLVKDFNSKNVWGIKVTAQSQVNFSNLYETVTAALPAADRPDLVIALPEHAQGWNNDGAVTDLSPYVSDPLYGIDSSDIPPVFWNQDLAGAVRVAVPAQRTARLLLWNKTWAGELGFDSPPAAPEDFQQQACRAQQSKLKDDAAQNDFMGGWVVDTEPATAYAWLLAFEGGVLEEGNYRFLAPNNIKAFKFLRELSEKQCAWQAVETDPITAFVNRDALFITASLEDFTTITRAFAAANSRDVWETTVFPGQNTLVVYGSSYVILKSTAEKQLAAWLFVRWLLDKEQDARWVETTHLFPLRSSTVDLLADYRKTHPQWTEAVTLLPRGQIQPQLASWRRVKVMLGDGFAHMYRVNMPSGQVALLLAQMQSTASELSK